MSILRTLAVWAEVALTKRHFKALKRKMDRTEAAAKSARERYEVEVDKPEGLHSRMEAFEEPEIGAPKGYAGDAYQDQVRHACDHCGGRQGERVAAPRRF